MTSLISTQVHPPLSRFPPHSLAGRKRDHVSMLQPEISDEDAARLVLHQAVHGDVDHRAEIRPSFFDVPQHVPFRLAFVSSF